MISSTGDKLQGAVFALKHSNIRAATPEWLLMPTPTTLTLAMSAAVCTSSPPNASQVRSISIFASAASVLGTVKVRSVINGGNVQNTQGDRVVETDLYSLPVSQETQRTCPGSMHAAGGDSIEFDVDGAYLNADRVGEVRATWVHPPK